MPGETFDFIVVGSGAGGIAAAIQAKLLGMRPLLLEKTPLIGGSSIMSGGVLWLPDNPLMRREGVADSREEALRYFDNFVPEGAPYSTPAKREAYVDTIAEFIETMERQGMLYQRCDHYSDYYDTKPGGNARGRAIEAKLFDMNRLGAWKAKTRLPSFAIPVQTGEAYLLGRAGVSLDGKLMLGKVGLRFLRAKLTGQMLCGSGGSLQGRMLEIALKLGIDIWTEAGLVDLDMQNGRVAGVHIIHEGKPKTIRAARGVLVSAGGFSHNGAMRRKYQQAPITGDWSFANPGDTGDAIEAMERAGAALAMMDQAWWTSNWSPPHDEPFQIFAELFKPHTILVDQAGNRMVNEAASYMEVGQGILARNRTTPSIPAWLVMDMSARQKYFFCFHPPGKLHQSWIDKGWIKAADTLAGLARECGIDPAGLEATVARYNLMSAKGVDEDYHKGESAYNRFYADLTHKPNPCMGPIEKAPYWAVQINPGDVGTCGGAIANERAEVLRADGSAIEGLWAAGNCTASLAGPHYIGAGQSIGASSIFGFIAAKQAAL